MFVCIQIITLQFYKEQLFFELMMLVEALILQDQKAACQGIWHQHKMLKVCSFMPILTYTSTISIH